MPAAADLLNEFLTRDNSLARMLRAALFPVQISVLTAQEGPLLPSRTLSAVTGPTPTARWTTPVQAAVMSTPEDHARGAGLLREA